MAEQQEKRWVTIVTVGFMVFSTFFGAGNLIFPPFLGFVGGGSSWLAGFIFFIIFDTVLGVLGLAASGKYPQVELGVFYRPGRKFMIIIGAVATFIGSLLVVVPRTALMSYQVFFEPIKYGGFGNVPQGLTGVRPDAIIFIVVFLALATFCAIRPSKVIDVVGKFLTPALLVILIILIVIGLANMSGTGVRPEAVATGSPSIIAFGITQGLQTFDAATGTIIAVIIIAGLQAKGIKKASDQTKTILQSGVVAAICLVVIYLGLALLGLFYSNDPALMEMYGGGSLGQIYLLNYIISSNLGLAGTVIFGLAVLFATFTTAIGCISLTSEYYSRISGRKLKYQNAVIIGMVIAFVIAIALSTTASGVDTLLNLTIPVLLITAPITVVLIILNLFTDYIKNDNVYRGATIAAGIWGLVWGLAYLFTVTAGIDAMPDANGQVHLGLAATMQFNEKFEIVGFTEHMKGFFNLVGWMFGQTPYSAAMNLSTDAAKVGGWNILFKVTGDLGYIIPAIIGGLIGACIKKGGYEERPYLREHAGDDSFDFAAAAAKKAGK
ncbi:MAG: branched-chain amino acid transport system II carrier protein [Spirochaetaceae bacterium]|jgi:LIVCS family branched-chain amino acid:cation transporter|nr:branched-chain amino acid transport system II carrier protein [Spirochaetaceae bacterium]